MNTIILGLILGIAVCLTSQQSANSNNIVFDLADLTVDQETNFGWITLEAFKSSLNDLIIKNKETENYGQLNWLSIGYPNLVGTYNSTSKIYQLFSFRPEGFDVSVEMLTNNYRSLFKDLVKRKYNIDINLNQIVSLIPSRFDCQLVFYKDNSKVLINGKVNQLTRSPLKLSFQAPLKTKERFLFEERFNKDKTNLNIEMFCEVNSQGKTFRQNTLVITGQQINQIGLLEEIFGPASEIYVSRNQVSSISSKLYLRLDVIEEYQIPETQFKESFIDDFIKQTSLVINKYVAIDEALSQLSKYDLSEDLKPSVIKNEFSKLFYVNKTGSKEYLQVNKTQYEMLNTEANKNTGGSSNIGFKLFSFSGSANYATSQKSDWQKLDISFNEQLNELNTYTDNEIEWARSGNIIIPKSLKVSRLSKNMFSKDLYFSRVKKEYYDAPFKRQFVLDTQTVYNMPQFVVENAQKLKDLENKIKSFEDLIKKLNTSISDTKNFTSLIFKNVSELNRVNQDIFNINLDKLNLDLLALKNQVSNGNTILSSQIDDLKVKVFRAEYSNVEVCRQSSDCVESAYIRCRRDPAECDSNPSCIRYADIIGEKQFTYFFPKPFKSTPFYFFEVAEHRGISFINADSNSAILKIKYCGNYNIKLIFIGN